MNGIYLLQGINLKKESLENRGKTAIIMSVFSIISGSSNIYRNLIFFDRNHCEFVHNKMDVIR